MYLILIRRHWFFLSATSCFSSFDGGQFRSETGVNGHHQLSLRTSEKEWKNSIRRGVSFAELQLITVHDIMASRLNRFAIKVNLLDILCKEDEVMGKSHYMLYPTLNEGEHQ